MSHLVIYEAAIAPSSVGGAKFHFVEIAGELAALARTEVITVNPLDLRDKVRLSLPDEVYSIQIPIRSRSITGYFEYEIKKSRWYYRYHRSRKDRPPVLLSRLSPFGVSTLMARCLGWPVVLEVNGLPDSEVESRGFTRALVILARLAVRMQLSSAQAAICVTAGIADRLRHNMAGPCVVIENGASPSVAPLEIARALGDRHRLVYVGVTAPWQELDVVLAALKELRAVDGPAWRLDIVGDGEQTDTLQKLASELGLDQAVTWHGWCPRDEAAKIVSSARVGLVPLRPKDRSGTCGSPLKLFEYLVLGRSVVASDVDGVKELNRSTRVCVYRQGDSSDLARAIREAAALEPPTENELRSLRQRESWADRAQRVNAVIALARTRSTPS